MAPGWCRRARQRRCSRGAPPRPRLAASLHLYFCVHRERRAADIPTRRNRVKVLGRAKSGRAHPHSLHPSLNRRRRPHRRRHADLRPHRGETTPRRCGGIRSTRSHRPHHRVLRITERRQSVDGHRGVIEVPALRPRLLVPFGRPAQQCDVAGPSVRSPAPPCGVSRAPILSRDRLRRRRHIGASSSVSAACISGP